MLLTTVCEAQLINALRPQFEHPPSGMAIGITVFSKKNADTGEWDRVGHIEWTSPLSGAVTLDGNEVRSSQSNALERTVHTIFHTGDHQRIPQGHKQDEHVRPAISTPHGWIGVLIPLAGHVGSSTRESNTNGKPVTTSRTIYTCVML